MVGIGAQVGIDAGVEDVVLAVVVGIHTACGDGVVLLVNAPLR
jgi:hypothetical protein